MSYKNPSLAHIQCQALESCLGGGSQCRQMEKLALLNLV